MTAPVPPEDRRPHVVVIGGPNGAGKSTAAPRLLQGTLAVQELINADVIAQGISAFHPESAAVEAGRIQIARIEQLVEQRRTFALESTLAGRSLAMLLARLQRQGYGTHLVYLWLPNSEMAVRRVQRRVEAGGHAVPEDVIRRRYERGLRNFETLYRPAAATWRVYDASGREPRLVAAGVGEAVQAVQDPSTWQQIASSGGKTRGR